MIKKIYLLTTCLLFISNTLFSQKIRKRVSDFKTNNISNNDTLRNTSEIKVKLSGKTKYTDYKVFSHKRDTSYIDTTLTIQKEYIFNFLRTDNFELLGFHNQGQTFNNLGYRFNNLKQLPDIGFTAKQFNYYEIDNIKYFANWVAAPYTADAEEISTTLRVTVSPAAFSLRDASLR